MEEKLIGNVVEQLKQVEALLLLKINNYQTEYQGLQEDNLRLIRIQSAIEILEK